MMALDHGSYRGDTLVSLQKQLATAWSPGRGLDARACTLRARDTESAVGHELKRLAADQWIRSGASKTDSNCCRRSAGELGIWLPRKPWQTVMFESAWTRAKVASRSLRVSERNRLIFPRRTLLVLDVYWSLPAA